MTIINKAEYKVKVSADVLEIIDHVIQDTNVGFVTIIVQDGRIVQIERTEKIMVNQMAGNYFTNTKRSLNEVQQVRTKILIDIGAMKYGQLVAKIKDGRVVQIEKTNKLRFPEVEGIYGDGI